MEEARKHIPAAKPEERLACMVAKNAHRHDGVYLAFQDVFRGV